MKERALVKQQAWGQVSDKRDAVHSKTAQREVVVPRPMRNAGLRPHGFQGPKSLIEQTKMALSTDLSGLYYYDQVERLK